METLVCIELQAKNGDEQEETFCSCSIAFNYDHFTDDEMEEEETEKGRKKITIIHPIKFYAARRKII